LAAALWKEPFACAFRKMNATKWRFKANNTLFYQNQQ
jgi:hypothetical protein